MLEACFHDSQTWNWTWTCPTTSFQTLQFESAGFILINSFIPAPASSHGPTGEQRRSLLLTVGGPEDVQTARRPFLTDFHTSLICRTGRVEVKASGARVHHVSPVSVTSIPQDMLHSHYRLYHLLLFMWPPVSSLKNRYLSPFIHGIKIHTNFKWDFEM